FIPLSRATMLPRCLLPPRDQQGKANKKAISFSGLFTDEIEDYLKLNFTHCYSFERYFKNDVFEELVRRESLSLEVARKATTGNEAYEILDRLMIEDNLDLWGQIHFPDVPSSSSFEVFSSRFLIPSGNFLVLDRVAAVLHVEPLIELMCPGPKYPSLRAAMANGPQIKANMARRFLRELPRLEGRGEDWFWSLIEACTQDAHNITRTLPYLLPNWQIELATHRSLVSSSSHSFDSLQRVLVAGASCRPPAEFEPYREEMTVAETCEMPELREYQKELVERTNRGENTIVCAPTGSGKTVVGAHVALHHLRSRAKEGKPARVVMIVPKVFLVEQQAKLFKNYTKKEYYIAKLSGDTAETGEPQLITFLSGDIVVLTPQILVNMLQSENEKARVYVADITLLLLDECHHTDKKNPYNMIMQAVKEGKHHRPQVVGLTASLGVGDGGIIVETQAFNHIVRMCVRMGARSVTTVMRNKEELAGWVKLPEDVIRRVMPMPLGDRRFHSYIVNAMSFVERHLYLEFDALIAEQQPNINFDMLARFPPLERFEEYTQAVVNVDTELRKLTDGERKWRLKRGIDFVKMYHNALLLNDLLPASYAFEQLSSDVSELDSLSPSGRHCSFLDFFNREQREFEMRVESEEDKEILQELRKELTNQFRVDSNSRVLIFCLRRETAQLLAKYLNQMRIEGMGRAEVLTSTNAASVKNGQSNSEQRAVIESFTKGLSKVIVATSVAEEGLDVAACNLIIKYNTTGNVISLVQQRGRARALGSRSVLLALDEKVYLKEYRNKSAEEIMMRTVVKIYEMGDAVFGEAIDKERIVQAKQEANEKEAEKRNANKHRELSLLCEKCNAPVCSSHSLRLFHKHFISVDSGLWRRMRVQAKKGAMIDSTYMVAGIIRCTCEREIGRVVKIQGQFVPTIQAEAILFKTTAGSLLSKTKKWKGIAANLLDVREGTTLEASAMNRALQSSNANLSKAMENLCLL
ncbi:hypothetical protein PENTCL1PPCAC_1133, partial [Pristionchus entomophagus]